MKYKMLRCYVQKRSGPRYSAEEHVKAVAGIRQHNMIRSTQRSLKMLQSSKVSDFS